MLVLIEVVVVDNKKGKSENWQEKGKAKCFNCQKNCLPNKVKFIKPKSEGREEHIH